MTAWSFSAVVHRIMQWDFSWQISRSTLQIYAFWWRQTQMQDSENTAFWIVAVNPLWSQCSSSIMKFIPKASAVYESIIGHNFLMYRYRSLLLSSWGPGKKASQAKSLFLQSNLYSFAWDKLRSQCPAITFYGRAFGQKKSLTTRSQLDLPFQIGTRMKVWHVWVCWFVTFTDREDWVSQIHPQFIWENATSVKPTLISSG